MTTIGIVGLGVIGGSFALAAKRAGHDVAAWDRDPETRALATGRGLALSPDLTAAAVIVLAAPMPALSDDLTSTLASVRISATATVTDVGSLKQPVLAAMRAAGLTERYVGGHPMAGSERTGLSAASADLFDGARWVLCLDPDDDVGSWLRVAALITDLGAGVLALTPAEHDAAMALLSGVPHLLALALAAAAARSGPATQQLAAGSFADLTRVAASSPTLLHALTVQNAPAVREALRAVLDELEGPWPALIKAGRAAQDHLVDRRSAARRSRDPSSADTADSTDTTDTTDTTAITVTDARSLLRLGRSGVVLDAIDPDTMVIRHRHPPLT